MSIVQAPIRFNLQISAAEGTKVPPPDGRSSSASWAIDNRSQNALHHELAEKALRHYRLHGEGGRDRKI
jgi:hypothetical protein